MNFIKSIFVSLILLSSLSLHAKGVKPSQKRAIKQTRIAQWKWDQVSKLAEFPHYILSSVRIPAKFEPGEPQIAVDVPESVRRAKEGGISCGYDINTYRTPRADDFFFAFKQTAQDGPWSTGSTWVGGVVPASGDQIQINHHVTTPSGTTNVAGLLVASTGWLEYTVGVSSKITSTANVEVQGLWTMKPSSVSFVHELQFTGIAESNFVGGGMDVLTTDIGLWVMQGGRADLVGATKKPWSNASGTVNAGATSMTVNDVTGWQIGDVIVMAPTGKPVTTGLDWDDFTNTPVDPFMSQFERRTITGIAGNVVSWTGGLSFSHGAVSSSVTSSTYGTSTRNWTAEVANITRNVKIGGTSTGRTHVFIRNTIQRVQNMQYVQFQYMGPRKIQAAFHASRPTLISGRYGIHFHFGDYFSQGSLVYGCSMSDIGNRGYVPHETHKITMNNNVALDYMETAFWWDDGQLSHFTLWEGNLMMGARYNGTNGVPGPNSSMHVSQGDGNIARRNVIVYGSNTHLHGSGGYVWNANSEGVWIFENNMSHSSTAGLFVWQNTTLPHTIIGYDSYNCVEGITHGAYGNAYEYSGFGHHYRSSIFIEASSSHTSGVIFKDIFIDAGGEPYGIYVVESPAGSGTEKTNKIIQTTIKNYATAGVRFDGGGTGGFAQRKQLDIINCDIGSNDGSEYFFNSTTPADVNEGSRIRLQKITGQNRQVEEVSGAPVTTNDIADFAPRNYGDGLYGLKGDYFNGNNFTDSAFSRYDAILAFEVWNADPFINPNGVHHLVTNDSPVDETYSVKWSGRIQANYTAATTITFGATGKYKVFFDDGGGEDLIIDRWATGSGALVFMTSASMNLTAGTKYNIRIEFENMSSGAQGAILEWKTPQMVTNQIIPQHQMFPPTTNVAPVAHAGSDQTIALPVSTANLSALLSSDFDGIIVDYTWTKISGPATYTITDDDAQVTTATGLVEGTYEFQVTVTDDGALTDADIVQIIVNPAPGNIPPTVIISTADQIITLPTNAVNTVTSNGGVDTDGTIAGILWTKTSGPSTFTISAPTSAVTNFTGLVQGTYIFTVTVTDDDGDVGTDQIQITVNPEVPNQPPIANAGTDFSIRMPATTAQLSGSGSDPDGFLLGQTWTQVSGPSTVSFTTPAAMETVAQNLIEGVYVFRLTVRDNGPNGGIHTADDVQVTVLRNYIIKRHRGKKIYID